MYDEIDIYEIGALFDVMKSHGCAYEKDGHYMVDWEKHQQYYNEHPNEFYYHPNRIKQWYPDEKLPVKLP